MKILQKNIVMVDLGVHRVAMKFVAMLPAHVFTLDLGLLDHGWNYSVSPGS